MVGGASTPAVQWAKFTCSAPAIAGDPSPDKALTPEQTLLEFISTSAAFHGITGQPLRSLESELLNVFVNNVMPANAAAWYMAKRKFYMKESFDQQLLPFLLKKCPEKFRLLGSKVIFLEVYEREAARHKLRYLVQAGLHAYFVHKIDEYGVYFFDPRHYEDTEPFHASLRQACPRAAQSQLVASYFGAEGMKEKFVYTRHNSHLVSVNRISSKVKVVTNTTGVIVSMINSQHGFIKFGSEEKAIFNAKSLFKDGWQFSGDPLKLPAMKFDGYQLSDESGADGEKKHSWFAMLVWCGRRPGAQHCSSASDLGSTLMFSEGRLSEGPGGGRRQGEVVAVRRDGAVLEVEQEDEDKVMEEDVERVWVPGWRRKLANRPGLWLCTVDGVCIGPGDKVTYCEGQEERVGYSAVGKSVRLLKEGGGGLEELGSDSESSGSVSEGELEWLERDLGGIIATEDPRARTMDLLRSVHVQLQEARGQRPVGAGVTADRAGYRPMEGTGTFRRTNELLAEGGSQDEESDIEYEPGDEVEEVEEVEEEAGWDSSLARSPGRGARRPAARLPCGQAARLPYWVRACSLPEGFDPQLEKFVPVEGSYREEEDSDYEPPGSDCETDSEGEGELLEDEVEQLVREAEEPLPEWEEDREAKDEPQPSGQAEDATEADDEAAAPVVGERAGGPRPRRRGPALWVRELGLTEQGEELDGGREYVPPATCLHSSFDYDEYSDGEIPAEEVAALEAEKAEPLEPPSEYVAVWVKVGSPAERIARAKEELGLAGANGLEDEEDETSGKEDELSTSEVEEEPESSQFKKGEVEAVGSLAKLVGAGGDE